ncbi:MAG: FtsH protease activity modulator HflK [Henriciella sp.]|nr:FtsH protease activity modulator HflK [Henriciella sp.]
MPWNDNSGNGGSSNEPPKASGGPWGGGGSGGGGGNGGSPWNRPGGGNKGPDLEDQMRRMQERFSRRGGGGGGRRGGRGGPNLGPGGFILLGVVALVAWLATGVVIVDEGERAAVFRFGEYQRNFNPGLHVHLPAPIETHEILASEGQKRTAIGLNDDERLMLTGDENIVDVQFTVFWFYSETPEDFILNVDHEGRNNRESKLVKDAAESVMREVVGKSTLDAVITTGRGEIQQNVRDQLQSLLGDYDAGVTIENVEIQEARQPGPVRAAFIDVINAGQDAEKKIQQANEYRNGIVNRAEGAALQILQDAEAYRDQVIADATGEADRFKQILAEYQKAPQVTRERMYLETMERVLGGTEKLILDSDSGAVPYLPLDRVNRSNQ